MAVLRERNQITLPPEIVESLGLKTGDDIDFAIDMDGSIRIIPMVQIPKHQAWFWTPEWQAGEREADEYLEKALHDGTFGKNAMSAKEFIAFSKANRNED